MTNHKYREGLHPLSIWVAGLIVAILAILYGVGKWQLYQWEALRTGRKAIPLADGGEWRIVNGRGQYTPPANTANTNKQGFVVYATELKGTQIVEMVFPPNMTNTPTQNTAANPVIQIHGEFGLVSGAYDIAVMADGHIVYSNYPLRVECSQVQPTRIQNVLSDMRKAGYWAIDSHSLSNAFSNVVVNDATQLTLTAFWGDEANTVTFERDCWSSPLAKECKAVTALRRSVDLIERKVLAARLP